MQVINGQHPTQVPQGLGASEKPVPTPPSSAPAGGAFRRGCLSPKGEFAKTPPGIAGRREPPKGARQRGTFLKGNEISHRGILR